ncbi:MAG: amidohydrolase family protein [Planctomycetota bacterium]
MDSMPSNSPGRARDDALRLVVPRALLASPERWIEGGALLVRAGRIVEVLPNADRVRRRLERGVRVVELADALLTPGLVNAHAHLELSLLRGRVARGDTFSAWIGNVLRERAAAPRGFWKSGWSLGAARALATGTTLVGDIDSTGAAFEARGPRPRIRAYREVLDAFDPRRTPAAVARLAARPSRRARTSDAVSPHAPHTVSDALLDAVARRARGAPTWIGVHWAETAEEGEWLERGTGPLAALLGRSPREAGLARLARRGLLGARTALYHGNHARAEELAAIARSGATLVHCPGTHAFFTRAPVDVAAWARRGVRVALGTDSLASNDDLDLALELARLRRAAPELAPELAWDFATRSGARALGFEGRAGELRPGAFADLAVWSVDRFERRAALDALTTRAARLDGVWLAGAPVAGLPDAVRGAAW